MNKADFSALPASKNLLLAAQKQLLEIPLRFFAKTMANIDTIFMPLV